MTVLYRYFFFRKQRDSDIRQVLWVPQMLRPDPNLCQACRVRYPAPCEEGILCPGLQRCKSSSALGQSETKVRTIHFFVYKPIFSL